MAFFDFITNRKTLLAGPLLVSLSGIVPIPLFSRSARAAQATVSLTGSFITGVKIAPGINVQIGQIAVTGINGSIIISPAGVITPDKAVTVGGGVQAGSFIFTAVGTVPVDVTVRGLGALTLTPSVGGLGPVGTAKLNKVIVGGIGAVPLEVADSGAGTGKVNNYNLTTKNGPIDIGLQITWGAVQPIGAFSQQISLVVAF